MRAAFTCCPFLLWHDQRLLRPACFRSLPLRLLARVPSHIALPDLPEELLGQVGPCWYFRSTIAGAPAELAEPWG